MVLPAMPALAPTAPWWPLVRWLACVVSFALFTAALVALTLTMLEVTSAGGFCARGGPYVIAVECSDRVSFFAPIGILGMFVALGISVLSRGFGPRLWALAWSALFITLGGAFLASAAFPNYSVLVAWLCGGIFIVMGGVPLVVVVLAARRFHLLTGSRTIRGERIEGRASLGQAALGIGSGALGVAGGWISTVELLAAM